MSEIVNEVIIFLNNLTNKNIINNSIGIYKIIINRRFI